MHTLIRIIALVVCCSVIALRSFGQQTPYLEKTVTIRSSTLSYSEIFKQLSAQTGVVFSYTNFDDNRRVSVQYTKKPLRFVLNDLFSDGGCAYKMKGKYVILTCKVAEKPKAEPTPTNVVVNGYIYNAEDSTLVAETSVYLRQNRQSAITNEYGYFSMSFPKTSDVLSISVAKENYEDTTIVVLSKQRTTIVIYLQPKAPATSITVNDSLIISYEPVKDSVRPVEDTLTSAVPFGFWKRFRSNHSNIRNISDTLFTDFSFSFVPPLSTNHLLSVNTVNKFSLNLLVGYSKGIDVLEIGGLVNVDNGNVRYAQIGGLTNLVSGSLTGFQAAGLVNAVGKGVDGVQVAGIVNLDDQNVDGFQAAGIGNIVLGNVSGMQVAGITNAAMSVDGGQVAGICNAADTATGFQLAGITNITEYSKGLQGAGIANLSARYIEGFQLAGISNAANHIAGAQIAGITNIAVNVKGFQLAGIVNVAGHIDGFQIGLLNFSDSMRGVPVGLFSYVHKGYHKIELATDENLLNTVSFRSGVNAFHNIFIAGSQFSGSDRIWTYGYGLGTAIRLSRKLYFNADLTGQQLQIAETGEFDYNLLTKAYIGLEWRIRNKFSIAAGPTLNWFNSDVEGYNYGILQEKIQREMLVNESNEYFSNQLWIGGRVSLKFL